MALYDAEQLKQLMTEDAKKARSINNYKEGTVKWQRKNLQILADYLWDLPEDYNHFNMRNYAQYYDTRHGTVSYRPTNVDLHECGSIACAIGHGVEAGIASKPSDTYWSTYSVRVFGGDDLDFSRLFCSSWSSIDNTTKGAAQRIYQYLEDEDALNLRYIINYRDQQPCRSL